MYERIVDEATKQISNYGFRKFTVDELTAELGISKKTIYKYFKSKNELISAIVDNFVEMEKKHCAETMAGESSWMDKFQRLFFLGIKYRIPLRLVNELNKFFPEEWEKINNLKQSKLALGEKLLVEGMSQGDIRTDITPKIILKSIDMITLNIILAEDFYDHDKITFNDVLEEIQQLLFYGLLKRD